MQIGKALEHEKNFPIIETNEGNFYIFESQMKQKKTLYFKFVQFCFIKPEWFHVFPSLTTSSVFPSHADLMARILV